MSKFDIPTRPASKVSQSRNQTKILMNDKLPGKIDEYLARLKQLCDAVSPDYATYSMKRGRKYGKVIMTVIGSSGISVHSFVDLNNGDILKAAGWAAPAKTARGSVFDLDAGGFDWRGAAYLK